MSKAPTISKKNKTDEKVRSVFVTRALLDKFFEPRTQSSKPDSNDRAAAPKKSNTGMSASTGFLRVRSTRLFSFRAR
jgi:hypothetical protein